MRPKSADRSTRPPRRKKPAPFYGWRYIPHTLPDGRVELEEVLLTLADVLHPQEGDVIPENSLQEQERGYLAYVFRSRLQRLRNGKVLSDCLVDWGVPGVRNHSPDVSVFDQLRVQPPPIIHTFRLRDFGGQCLFVIEIVSTDTRTNDVDRKPAEYYQAGIPLYLIVDQEEEDGPRRLVAYRRGPLAYESLPLDADDRLLLEPLGLRIGLRENRVVCWDAETGEEMRDYTGELQARLAEAQARQEAERRAQAEAQARQEAERRAQAEAQARQAETQAREEAERRLRELEEQLHRLQGKSRKGKRPPGTP